MARTNNAQAGFTLTEMLVALSILIFGLTALAGSMTAGVSQRRGWVLTVAVVQRTHLDLTCTTPAIMQIVQPAED